MLAELNFIRLMAYTPMGDLTDGKGGNLSVETREVELQDADSVTPAPTLASHGFEAVPFSASFAQFEADHAYANEFAKLCAAAVKRQTGAALVLGMPVTVQIRRGDGTDAESPIVVSHTDFTPTSTLQKAVQVLSTLKQKVRPARIAAFNAWWLVSTGPQDRPLAFCDATTIAPADLQLGRAQVLGPNKAAVDYGEIAYQRYSERQRWYWYPDLTPERVLLFCGFDSDSSRPSMVTHCAFTNPECPPGTPARVSVECRCLAFW